MLRSLLLVLVAISAFGCKKSSHATTDGGAPASLSAEEKIRAAERGGAIDHDHALLYYLYAATDNPLLPARYEADGPDDRPLPELTAVLNDAQSDLPTMPAELQGAFAPFFARPDHAGSAWLGASTGVTSASYGGVHTERAGSSPQPASPAVASASYAGFVDSTAAVRVWYPTEAQKPLATQIAAEIDAAGMYTKEQKIMAATPCDDGFLSSVDNGGSSALDMYIVDFHTAVPHRIDARAARGFESTPAEATLTFAMDVPEHFGDACTTSYVLLRDGDFGDFYKAAVAHEMFHAFQHGVPGWISRNSASWNWVDEATATWVEDQIYPSVNSEQEFLGHAATSNWNTSRGSLPDCAGGRPEAGPLDCSDPVNNPAYSSYLFFFALTRSLGADPGIVGQLYHSLGMRSLDAVRALVPSFDDAFKQFALWNLNEGPALHYKDVGADFSTKDLSQSNTWLPPSPGAEAPRIAVGHGDDLSVVVGPTRIGYYDLKVDDGATSAAYVKQLYLDLSELHGKPGLALQAVIDLGHPGEAGYRRVVEDWTMLTERKFCRDQADQVVTKIILVADNPAITGSAITGAVHGQAKSACGEFQGTLVQSQMVNGTYTDPKLPGKDGTIGGTLTATSKWNITFMNRDPNTNDAIYAITAENTFDGSFMASFSGANDTAGGSYSHDESFTASISSTIGNPAGPADPSTVNPDYGPSDPGTIDVDSQGNYQILFITGNAFVTASDSQKFVTTTKNIYNAGNPAPAGSGCGADEVNTQTSTYDSGTNIRHDVQMFCTHTTGDSSSDPSVLRPAVGQVGSNIDLFFGKLDGNGEIHGTATIPSTSCELLALSAFTSSTATCTAKTVIQLDVKLPAASF